MEFDFFTDNINTDMKEKLGLLHSKLSYITFHWLQKIHFQLQRLDFSPSLLKSNIFLAMRNKVYYYKSMQML